MVGGGHFVTRLSADPSVLSETLVAHTDAVWGLSIHSTRTQLLSCSGDGTVRLWSPGAKQDLLNTYCMDDGQWDVTISVLFSGFV